MKTENIAIILSVIALFVSGITWYSDHNLQEEMLGLQKEIAQKEEIKENMPPTVWLTQEFRNGSYGQLEIIPTWEFGKNNDRLFTISNFEINVTLNGKYEPITGAGYPKRFGVEGISYGTIAFGSFYPASITEYNFFHTKNDLIIDYVLEIKDMDSQDRYRGNVTTEIDSSISPPKNFSSGRNPLIFKWVKI